MEKGGKANTPTSFPYFVEPAKEPKYNDLTFYCPVYLRF